MTANTPQSRKQKGAGFEKKVARFFSRWFPDAERDGRSRHIDVRGTPWWVECKRTEKLRLGEAIKQAVAARDYRDDPRPIIVVSKKNREDMLVSMRMVDFVRIAGLDEVE